MESIRKLKDFELRCPTRKEIKERNKVHARQQKDWGFCDADLWGLDITIAQFILPRLVRFREIGMGYPGILSEKRWGNILDKIIAAFEILSEDNYSLRGDKKSGIVKCGLKLFAKWFEDLWD